jgi:hypothetical protein
MKHLHEKRGISFAELGALLGVRTLLANGLLAHVPYRNHGRSGHRFNMAVACSTNDQCGSVQCIGGAMGVIMGYDKDGAVRYVENASGGLSKLFFPPQDYRYVAIEPKQAIKAIDNFLKVGKPLWEKVLRRDQLDK